MYLPLAPPLRNRAQDLCLSFTLIIPPGCLGYCPASARLTETDTHLHWYVMFACHGPPSPHYTIPANKQIPYTAWLSWQPPGPKPSEHRGFISCGAVLAPTCLKPNSIVTARAATLSACLELLPVLRMWVYRCGCGHRALGLQKYETPRA